MCSKFNVQIDQKCLKIVHPDFSVRVHFLPVLLSLALLPFQVVNSETVILVLIPIIMYIRNFKFIRHVSVVKPTAIKASHRRPPAAPFVRAIIRVN